MCSLYGFVLSAFHQSEDWIRISEMLLGPRPESFRFIPKHRANAYASVAAATAATAAARKDNAAADGSDSTAAATDAAPSNGDVKVEAMAKAETTS